jgi:trans-aconitate 2-methyltransferase
VFATATRDFLGAHVDHRPRLAVDLGCGPGHSTRLLAEVTAAERVVGLDASESFLDEARRSVGNDRISFARHDATVVPFPTPPPDLVFARLLLAHLPEPAAVAASWAAQLAPGGRLLLDEVEWIETRHPALAFYEEVVVGLVGSRGALMYAGPAIAGLEGEGWRRRSSQVRVVPVRTADAAAMYAMNLGTWRHDPFVDSTYDPEPIEGLARDLEALARSTATGEITWGLRQVALERTELH